MRKPLLSVLLLNLVGLGTTLSFPLLAQDPPDLRLANSSYELRLGFVNDNIARVQLLPLINGNAIESDDSPHLLPQQWKNAPLRTRTLPAQPAILTLNNHRLTFDPSTFTIRLELSTPGNAPRSQSIKIDPATQRITFPIDGPLFGLGEGGQPHDRRGSIDPLEVGGWTDTPFPLNDYGEQLGIPWLVSPTTGWALYIHRPTGTFDLTDKENGAFIPTTTPSGRRGPAAEDATNPQPIDLFLVLAPQPPELLRAFAEISGYPSLPPLWSLGYIQSHRELESADQIVQIARTFREKSLPCDMLIYLGAGFAPIGWNTGHGEFTFHPAIFPNPEGQLTEFHKLNFKVALHVTPRGPTAPRRLAGRVTDPIAPGPYDASSVSQYWSKHADLMKLGVDAWWPDEGENLPAASRLARIQMYYEGPQQLHPDQRPYALHRTGAVGMQRYGGWLWSGDIKSTWDVLARQIPLGLNVSAGLTPFWGTDTGGFYQDAKRELTGELFARWFQFSAFCPLFRSHGRDWRYRHLPWGFSDIEGPDRDPHIEDICRKYLDLRYQLMPYTYSVVYQSHETNLPITRPLWLHYPDDAASVSRSDEYLWGRDMLLAPVVQKGATQRTLYLPPGQWHDFWTHEKLEGGKEIARAVDLATLPIYVRAGAILPLGPKENYTAEKPNNSLTLQIYPGADGQFAMTEDDGLTFSAAPMRLKFSWTDSTRTLTVELDPTSKLRDPIPRKLQIQLIGQPAERTLDFTSERIEVHL